MRCLWLGMLLVQTACSAGADRVRNEAPSLKVGLAALDAGMPQAALAVAQRQLASNRDNVPALLIQARAFSDMGEAHKAVASFRRAVDLAPDGAGGHFGLGRVLLADGQAVEAERELRQVLAIEEHDPRALMDLGIALDLQDKHEEAQAMYRAALAAAPNLDAARINLGLSLALGGNANDAVDILRPLAAAPDAPRRVRHDLATALTLAGDRPAAERLLQQDLTPEQTTTALAAYGSLGKSGP